MTPPVWRNEIELDAWRQQWCDRCFQPDEAVYRITGQGGGCPIYATSLTDVPPPQWHRRRADRLGDTYRCDAFLDKPPVTRRPTAVSQDEPMFDVEPADRRMVPVEGWPDYRATPRAGDDHS